uniref:Lipoxygenase n=1 Tax=Leersia perrieri TaxID=77586 RepID=A0A0D9VDA6_9ORYZ
MIHLKQPLLLSAKNTASPAPCCSQLQQQRAGRINGGGGCRKKKTSLARISCSTFEEAAGVSAVTVDRTLTVTATVTVQSPVGVVYAARGIDDLGDLFGKSLLLELVSSELDAKTGKEKEKVSAFAHKTMKEEIYEAEFEVPATFGPVGAVLVENEHHREMFIKEIRLVTGTDDSSAITFDCNSWVHSKFDNPELRVFFTVKSYLPSKTPKGIEALRKKELETIRGDGTGERKFFERIYDYDVYNDLGDPDYKIEHLRPVLGGDEHPYPRRCRTGRPHAELDPQTERRRGPVYVPRDEQFSDVKGMTFSATTLRSGLHAMLPALEPLLKNKEVRFPHFPAIDGLYSVGIPLPSQLNASASATTDIVGSIIPRLVRMIEDTTDHVLRFEVPAMFKRDRFSWYKDEEFARQVLAGVNPICIQLLTEFPIVSKLDPEVYGPPESALTKELLESRIMEPVTVEEAMAQRRLFILDYHDVFLPYVHRVRERPDTTLYGSRTVFFLTDAGTLSPLAIELTRPRSPTRPRWSRAFVHGADATSSWLWKMAKAHVLSHDTGYHQLVSHWLRTHCCVEPYIIAANRRLSRMHPVYRLLHPHFRYTMEINALARESLINADGIIEESFWPGKYSMEISSMAYAATWRFDAEALPEDLVRRGLAVRKNGDGSYDDDDLELTIKDYPYANDGLLVWNAIKQWASDYVRFYYKSDEEVAGDEEVQEWWWEVRNEGHADKKDEPWWPAADTRDGLIGVLTTIMWVTSGHHAAVNFGQYHYGGYFPNRPTVMRKKMPVEDDGDDGVSGNEEEMRRFMSNPEHVLLDTMPSQMQAIKIMATLDILSSHSPDEEYMGEYAEPAWMAEPMVKAAFEKFAGRMKEIEGVVDERNNDPELRNRCGAGIVPYELLKPFSSPGVTGRGIPNSISI